MKPKVAFVLGSDSDFPVIEEALKLLGEFEVPFEVTVSSAHRSPERTHRYAVTLEERGIQVIIACAGGAAHLAGVLASHTILPVVGVPIASSPLQGYDSLLSTAMMPAGVPVATMAIGQAGASSSHPGGADPGPQRSCAGPATQELEEAIGGSRGTKRS